MRLELGPETVEALRAHAVRAFPEECCGALLVDAAGTVTARPLENVAPERRHGFLVAARDYLSLERDADARGLALCGFYHSHPDAAAVPSAADVDAAWPRLWTVIVPVTASGAAAPRAFLFDDTTRTFTEGALP